MIDFSKCREARARQDSICAGGEEFKIRTEFFIWLGFEKKLDSGSPLYFEQLDYLYITKPPEDKQAAYEELLKFYRYPFINPLPRPPKKQSGAIGYDWEMDSEMIYAAFLQQYGIDLLESDLHWHNFISLFYSLTGTCLNQAMSFRSYDGKDKAMKELKERWEIKKNVKRPVPKMV